MSRSKKVLAVILLAVFAVALAGAQEKVEFQAPTLEGGTITLTGLLDVPEGPGPFPAVVLLHDAAGFSWDLGAANYAAWAARLVQWGFVSLRVDSFGPRGVTEVLDPYTISARTRANDAYAARDYLAKLPKVAEETHRGHGVEPRLDGRVVHHRRCISALSLQAFPGLRLLLPRNADPPAKAGHPLLLLYGDNDVFCPRSLVEQLGTSWSKGDRKFESTIVRYPGATHGFDVEGLNEDSEGVHYEYDPAAAADAIQQVKEFLERYLGK